MLFVDSSKIAMQTTLSQPIKTTDTCVTQPKRKACLSTSLELDDLSDDEVLPTTIVSRKGRKINRPTRLQQSPVVDEEEPDAEEELSEDSEEEEPDEEDEAFIVKDDTELPLEDTAYSEDEVSEEGYASV